MYRISTWTAALLVAALWVTATSAQQRVVPEGTTVKLLLLRQKSVQKELDISPETADKIKAFTHKQHESALKALDMDTAERKEALGKLEKQNRTFLADTLSPKQAKRLDQIAMQFTALTHLTRPKTAKLLKLSEEQQKKLKALRKEAHKKVADIIHAKDAAGKSEKLAELHESTRESVMAILNDEQKAQVREMAGPPFKGKIVIEEAD